MMRWCRYETDPDNVNRVRMAISEASKDLILLQETLSYLQESLDEVLHRRVFTYVLGLSWFLFLLQFSCSFCFDFDFDFLQR